MKIQSIGTLRQDGNVRQTKTNKYDYVSMPKFTGQDSFSSKSYSFDNRLSELKDTIDAVITPFKQQYGENFIRLGKIGFDAQEKLALVKKNEKELFYKKLYASDNETFKQSEKNVKDYEKYTNNINNFKHYEELSKKEPYFSNPAIVKIIDDNHEKFAGDVNEFDKLKTYYDTVKNTTKAMHEELNKINLKNIPDAAEQIEKLDNKHIAVIVLFLLSDYTQMSDIYKEYNAISTGYKNKTMPINMVWNRIDLLEENLQKFAENDANRADTMKEIDKFLEEDYKDNTENISANKIKSIYEQLFENTDKTISKYTEYLKKYNADTKLEIDKKLINKTLKYQNTVNAKLASLIQQEKEKIYKKSYDEFNKLFSEY